MPKLLCQVRPWLQYPSSIEMVPAGGRSSMDMESSRGGGVAEVVNSKRQRRLRRRSWARRALLAVCVAAATLAVVELYSAGVSPSNLSVLNWLLQDAPPSNLTADQLLDGLLTAKFGERSCRSRYKLAGYYKKASHTPSPYLLSKLRKQEELQQRCGPGTASYWTALRQLKSGKGAAANDCRYLVTVSYRGLGNRMLATTSAFLYAVLTERVLLVYQYKEDHGDLFCEPFPRTTWLLPAGWRFPIKNLRDLGGSSEESLGNRLKTNSLSVGPYGNASWSDDGDRRPPYVYLHLEGRYDFHDELFYCDDMQLLLRGPPWLLMKTDSYLVPGLYLVPSFQDELGKMFPEKDRTFYHLGRYLFHPSNVVWDAVTSYYKSHLAGVGQRVGIQIRVFVDQTPPLQQLQLDQVLSCVREKKLLPDTTSSSWTTSKNGSDQAVLVTSLSSWYYERITDEYGRGRVAGGVHQPSHEGKQKWGDTTHDAMAMTEIYLLSTCDVLVTTGFSTFGYVAQGLAGIRPWIMPREPPSPCVRAASVEPCFHSPSYYDCAARRDVDLGKVVPYVRRCEDVSWGIKLINGTSGHS